jgi:hypothetical protein
MSHDSSWFYYAQFFLLSSLVAFAFWHVLVGIWSVSFVQSPGSGQDNGVGSEVPALFFYGQFKELHHFPRSAD